MAHKTTFLAGLIFLLSSLLFAQGELNGPVYIIGDDGRLYIDHIPDTITASYLAVIDDGWLKKLDIDNLELDTSNIAGLYGYLNAKSDTGHIHDTSDVNNLSLYLGQKLDVSDTSDLARKIHGDRHLPGGPDDFFPSGTGGFLHYGDGVAQPASWEWRYPAVADVTGLQSTLDLKLDVTDTSVFVRDPELDNFYTKTNLQTSEQASVHWGNLTNKPSVFPPEAHNHSASDINSGTLSNDRLSFNPDYFVQGTDSRRSDDYDESNPLDNNFKSGFFYLRTTDPANTLGSNMHGIRSQIAGSDNYSLEILGRANLNKLYFGGISAGTRYDWREIWHSGNLDTANIVNRTDEQYINGTKRFSQKLYADGGVYTTYNVGSSDRYWRFRDGLFLFYNGSQIMGCNPVTDNKLKWEVPFDIREKVEISDTLILGNKQVLGGNIVAQYLKNNTASDSTSASINFGFSASSGYHHAAVKAMRTNRGASHASSIYLQARPAGSGAGTGHLEDVVEAGFDDQQAYVEYHNNPSIIHSPDSLIFVNTPLTFNPHRGSYAAYSGNPPQTMTLGSGEPGQTVEFAIVEGTFPLTIVYEGGYVETEYGKIYKFKYIESLGWFKYE